MKIKIDEIKIRVFGKDRNRSYLLEPEEKKTSIDEAIDYLMELDQSGDFEKPDKPKF